MHRKVSGCPLGRPLISPLSSHNVSYLLSERASCWNCKSLNLLKFSLVETFIIKTHTFNCYSFVIFALFNTTYSLIPKHVLCWCAVTNGGTRWREGATVLGGSSTIWYRARPKPTRRGCRPYWNSSRSLPSTWNPVSLVAASPLDEGIRHVAPAGSCDLPPSLLYIPPCSPSRTLFLPSHLPDCTLLCRFPPGDRLFFHCCTGFPPGDCLFFHSNVLHTADKNDSDMRRWAFLVAYNRRDNDPIYTDQICQNYTPINRVITTISFSLHSYVQR